MCFKYNNILYFIGNVSIFPTEFDNEFVHFFKNVGMIGGLVLYLEIGI